MKIYTKVNCIEDLKGINSTGPIIAKIFFGNDSKLTIGKIVLFMSGCGGEDILKIVFDEKQYFYVRDFQNSMLMTSEDSYSILPVEIYY